MCRQRMKLVCQVLERIKSHRTWVNNSVVGIEHVVGFYRLQAVPTRLLLEIVNQKLPTNENQRIWLSRHHRLKTHLRPILSQVISNGLSAGNFNQLCDKCILAGSNDRIGPHHKEHEWTRLTFSSIAYRLLAAMQAGEKTVRILLSIENVSQIGN